MEKIGRILVFIIVSMTATLSNAEVKHKGFFNIGGGIMKGDTYQYVMGCDGKIGLSANTEQGIVFDIGGNEGIFIGAGIGFDYVNVALDTFDPEELETKNILSNTVMSIPLYATIKYIYNVNSFSMVYAIRGGYYKWIRGRYINETAQQKDYKIPYQGNYMIGFGVGIRIPINVNDMNKYGVNIMFNYDFMSANTKMQNSNIANNKVGISIGLDF